MGNYTFGSQLARKQNSPFSYCIQDQEGGASHNAHSCLVHGKPNSSRMPQIQHSKDACNSPAHTKLLSFQTTKAVPSTGNVDLAILFGMQQGWRQLCERYVEVTKQEELGRTVWSPQEWKDKKSWIRSICTYMKLPLNVRLSWSILGQYLSTLTGLSAGSQVFLVICQGTENPYPCQACILLLNSPALRDLPS